MSPLLGRNVKYVKRQKVSQQLPAGLLQPLAISERVWHDISLDFVEGLPVSGGHDISYCGSIVKVRAFSSAQTPIHCLNDSLSIHKRDSKAAWDPSIDSIGP